MERIIEDCTSLTEFILLVTKGKAVSFLKNVGRLIQIELYLPATGGLSFPAVNGIARPPSACVLGLILISDESG